MDVNNTSCGHHFAACTYIKSLCCTPKTNTVLDVNYIAIKKLRNSAVKRRTKEKGTNGSLDGSQVGQKAVNDKYEKSVYCNM